MRGSVGFQVFCTKSVRGAGLGWGTWKAVSKPRAVGNSCRKDKNRNKNNLIALFAFIATKQDRSFWASHRFGGALEEALMLPLLTFVLAEGHWCSSAEIPWWRTEAQPLVLPWLLLKAMWKEKQTLGVPFFRELRKTARNLWPQSLQGPVSQPTIPCRASCPRPDHSPGKLHSAALHPELPSTWVFRWKALITFRKKLTVNGFNSS